MSPLAPFALGPRRALAAADEGLATTVQRLSTGLRVNSARDDAAGLAIAERLQARQRGGAQAVRNANDAISMLQTADGALQGMAGLLQRMREDLLQAMNGSNSVADVASLDADLRQTRDELDRLAAAASFNGMPLLAGDEAGAERLFQVGAGSDDTLLLPVGAPMRAADLGRLAIADSVDLRTLNNTDTGFAFVGTYTTVRLANLDFSRPEVAFSGGALRSAAGTPTDYSGGGSAQFSVDGRNVTLAADYGSAAGVAAAIQSQLDGTRYAVSAEGGRVRITKTARASGATAAPVIANASGNAAAFTGGEALAGTAAAATTNAGFTVDGARVALTADHSGNFAGLVADIQAQLDRAGRGRYSVSGSEAGLSITRTGAISPPVVGGFTGAGASVFAEAPRSGYTLGAGDLSVQVGGGAPRWVTGTFQTPQSLVAAVARQVPGAAVAIDRTTGALQIASAKRLVIGGSAAEASGALAFRALEVEPSGSLMDLDATDPDEARRSLLRVDAALDAVNAQRAVIGASQGRLDAVIAQLQLEGETVAATRGRIVDADMGAEAAALARRQVLQQAGMAMVAQANARPRDVLDLLR